MNSLIETIEAHNGTEERAYLDLEMICVDQKHFKFIKF